MAPSQFLHRTFRVTALLLLCALGSPTDLHAEAVGSPASLLKKGRWVFGLDTSLIVDRTLKHATGPVEIVAFQGGHSRGFGLTDWLSLYGTIGTTALTVKERGAEHRFGSAILLSTQLKGKLWENRKKDLEWDGSVKFVHLRSRHKAKNEGTWNEWVLATGMAKRLGNFKPYAGVKLSLVEFNFTSIRDDVVSIRTYDQDGYAGPYVGLDYAFGPAEGYVINIEGSYIDGAEISTAVTYKF